jgi:segregation and condensation protein A
MEQEIYQMLMNEDEITWQNILHDLVKKENMNPWDVDVTNLTQHYIKEVKKLKSHDFRVSGKVILAAAILLKIKSNRFVGEDMVELDRLIHSSQDFSQEEFYEELHEEFYNIKTPGNIPDIEKNKLIPRTPRARKRKVSIYDLMNALEQALEVRRRHIVKSMPDMQHMLTIPENLIDLGTSIKQVHMLLCNRIRNLGGTMAFSDLVPLEDKEAKINTFVPLLHLTNLQRIDLNQEEHFGEIDIALVSRKPIVEKIEEEAAPAS